MIDGQLDYGARVTETEVTAEVHGDLTFSGDAEGTCAIDIEARVTSEAVGASATVNGNLCGYGWAEVFG